MPDDSTTHPVIGGGVNLNPILDYSLDIFLILISKTSAMVKIWISSALGKVGD